MAKERIKLKEELIRIACSIAIKAHKSTSNNPYLCEISSSQVIFGFSGSWEIGEWFTHMPFGDAKINLNLFPSLKTIGSNEPSKVNQAFMHRFETLLEFTSLKNEVQRAAIEKQILFTGHSSGGAIAIFATLWFLESQTNPPLCITFGSPLVGDTTLTHAINREHWARYFTHFIMRYDIVPRISLSPLSCIHRELQTIVQYLNPNSPFYASDSIARASETSSFVMAVIKNASLVTGYQACNFMGSTNLILENVTNFVELSPYKPFGTYVFCAGNGKFISLQNSDAIQQILFYCLQISSESKLNEVLQRSLK